MYLYATNQYGLISQGIYLLINELKWQADGEMIDL